LFSYLFHSYPFYSGRGKGRVDEKWMSRGRGIRQEVAGMKGNGVGKLYAHLGI
jgi:hypothetical protein